MKDLYRRCGLNAYEKDQSKLTNVNQGLEEDQTACFSILLNPDRKAIYDNTHRALIGIAKARRALQLNSNAEWEKRYADFVESALTEEHTQSSVDQKSDKHSSLGSDSSDVGKTVPHSASVSSSSENPKSRLLQLAAGASAMVLIVMVLIFSGTDDTVEHSDDMETLLEPQLMHVKSVNAAIYPKMISADEFVEPMLELENQTEITVEKISLDGQWVWINAGKVKGYTLRSNLRSGPSEKTIVAQCREAGTSRPASSVISNFFAAGQHQLTLANPPGKDAVVKLKSGDGEVQLMAYLRAGDELIVEGIADGNHRLEYAVGENYSPQCGRFVDHMQTFREEKRLSYSGGDDLMNDLSDRHVYILKSKVVGLKTISNHAF